MNNEYSLKQVHPVNTAAQWAQINPTLLKGEIAFESDTHYFKIGDGVTAWNDLHYANVDNKLTAGEGIEFELVNNTTKIKSILTYTEVELS